MRASFTALLLIVLLLPACNLPNQQRSPSPDAIATEVAAQLAQLPTSTEVVLPTGTATSEPATAVPTEPEPASTETLAPTATVPPTDPRLTLGNPTWREPFDSGNSFGLGSGGYDDDQTSIRVENGALVLTSKNAAGYHGWRTGGPVSADRAYVEGVFQVGDCAGADQYGLVFRSPDFVEGYWFNVRCDGRYAFGYWVDNESSFLLDEQDDRNAILTGANQTNRLGVLADGDRFTLYANGVLLREVTDSTFSEGGHSGALIAGYRTTGFTVRLDEIAHWTLP